MSMRSLLNSRFVGDLNLYDFNLDINSVEFNIFLKVVDVDDRVGPNGELVYPWDAYYVFDQLLESNEVRFGTKEFYDVCCEGGLKEILNHPWFGEFDYDTMLKKEYEAEYKPKLSDNMFDV